MRILSIALAGLFLSGCVVYPKQVEYYDGDCDIVAKKLVLDAVMLNNFGSCSDKACAAVILGVAVSSAIVSGSIVIVGNTVYWLQKQGNCIVRRV